MAKAAKPLAETQGEGEDEGVSSGTLAQLFACDERTIRNLAKDGIAVRVGHGKYLLAPTIRNYVVKLREEAAGRRGGGNEDAVAESAGLKREQKLYWAKKNAILDQKLIDREKAQTLWSGVIRSVRAIIERWPDRVRFELPHLTDADFSLMQGITRELLTDAGAGKLLTEDPPLPQVTDDDGPD